MVLNPMIFTNFALINSQFDNLWTLCLQLMRYL